MVSLVNCYPGIDDTAIRTVQVSVDRRENGALIEYNLDSGSILVTIIQDKDKIVLQSCLKGLRTKPYRFSPIFEAYIDDCDGVYRQGFGFGGPSGYSQLKQKDEEGKLFESFGLVALCNDRGSLFTLADTHDRFINNYQVEETKKYNKLKLTASFICEKSIDETSFPNLVLFTHTDLSNGLEACAKYIANAAGVKNRYKPAFHWCSWYYNYYSFSYNLLSDYIEGMNTMKTKSQFQYIQIDDGYCTSQGDWLEPNALWPGGLKPAFELIAEEGFKPGIWIAPFMVGNRSRIVAEHPDWLLRDMEGELLKPWKVYGETKMGGRPDEEYYILDTSHPDAFHYIRCTIRTMKAWGARLFKTDFLLWGVQDSTKVRRHTPGKTSIEYLMDVVRLIIEELGEDCFWLACISPFMPLIGYADGMRIAGDISPEWTDTGEWGTPNMIREVTADNYFNQIFWQNDPDSILLRDFHTYLSSEETSALALFQAISGGIITTSDPIHKIGEDRKELLNFVKPGEMFVKPTLLDPKRRNKEIVMVHKLEGGKYIIFIFNPIKDKHLCHYTIKEVTGKNKIFIRNYNKGEYSKEAVGELLVPLEPHSFALYFGSEQGVIDQAPKNLWVWY